jgi:ElaB/YqjD/DUF883 family membrane-anchored ribosome-binding protein
MVLGVSDERPAWRKQLEQSLAELETLGTQVASKLGDVAKDAGAEAAHEAKKAWHKLEPRIGEVRDRLRDELRDAGGEAAKQLEGMVAELRSSLKTLRDKL